MQEVVSKILIPTYTNINGLKYAFEKHKQSLIVCKSTYSTRRQQIIALFKIDYSQKAKGGRNEKHVRLYGNAYNRWFITSMDA